MPLHCRVWIKHSDDYHMPVDPFAIVEVLPCGDGDYYVPVKCQCVSGNEVKWTIARVVKRYEQTRSYPFILICAIKESLEEPTWELLEELPETRTWKCMVSWPEVIDVIQETVLSKWYSRVAGYDGPETKG